MQTSLDATSVRRWRVSVLQAGITGGIWFGAMATLHEVTSTSIGVAAIAGLSTASALERTSERHRLVRSYTQDVNDVLRCTLFGTAAYLAAATAFGPSGSLVVALLALAIVTPALLVARSVVARSRSRRDGRQRLVIVGVGDEAAELVDLVTEHPEARFELLGVVGDPDTADRSGLGQRWLGDTDVLDQLVRDHQVDSMLLTTTGFRSTQFRRIIAAARNADIEVFLSSGVDRIGAHRVQVDSLVHEPLIAIEWNEPDRLHALARRTIDVVGASVGLLVASPVMLTAAIAIKAYDRGPVFYRSDRIGRGGERFGMLKFRSMQPDAEKYKNDLANRNERSGPLFKVSNDPRITPVGRLLRETSIDELPQLVNVLKGEMSLVGPRPALPEEADVFDAELQARFSVNPGITGLWQVEARSNAEFGAYRRLDLHYIDNRSLWLDLQIIIATAVQVVTSMVLLPVSLVLHRGVNDAVVAPSAIAPVIDLRAKTDRAPSSSAAARR